MERLKDEASTNLYIEGLPLQIDEPVCTMITRYVCVFLTVYFSWQPRLWPR